MILCKASIYRCISCHHVIFPLSYFYLFIFKRGGGGRGISSFYPKTLPSDSHSDFHYFIIFHF